VATTDVPGVNPGNGDVLKQGCWAESPDGSLLFVTSTENGRVIYSIFDMSKPRVVEYRDAMDEVAFKRRFTAATGSKVIWTWHDKAPFPWDSVIKRGAEDGARLASAEDILDHADDVADSRRRLYRKSDAEQVAEDEGLSGAGILSADLQRRAASVDDLPRSTRRLADGLALLLDQYFRGR
jgi:hypothetical protein